MIAAATSVGPCNVAFSYSSFDCLQQRQQSLIVCHDFSSRNVLKNLLNTVVRLERDGQGIQITHLNQENVVLRLFPHRVFWYYDRVCF